MGTFISEKRHWAQVLAPATVYSILATVYWHLWNWVPTINWIGQKGCLQFIGSLGHYFTPGLGSSANLFRFLVVHWFKNCLSHSSFDFHSRFHLVLLCAFLQEELLPLSQVGSWVKYQWVTGLPGIFPIETDITFCTGHAFWNQVVLLWPTPQHTSLWNSPSHSLLLR